MTSENVRFCLAYFCGFRKENGTSCKKSGFSYRFSYLIDKKGYRKSIFIKEKNCRLKKNTYFCAVKMAIKTNVFVGHFVFYLYLNHNQSLINSEFIKIDQKAPFIY